MTPRPSCLRRGGGGGGGLGTPPDFSEEQFCIVDPHGPIAFARAGIECPAARTDITQQSARLRFDRRSARVSYSLAAIPAIPANSHRARASAFRYWQCPSASRRNPSAATGPASGHVSCWQARWRWRLSSCMTLEARQSQCLSIHPIVRRLSAVSGRAQCSSRGCLPVGVFCHS